MAEQNVTNDQQEVSQTTTGELKQPSPAPVQPVTMGEHLPGIHSGEMESHQFSFNYAPNLSNIEANNSSGHVACTFHQTIYNSPPPTPTSRSANAQEPIDLIHAETKEFVSSHIGHDWKKLGRKFGLMDTELDKIQYSSQYRLDEMANGVLSSWIRKKGKEATESKLIMYLFAIERKDMAETLIEKLGKNGE